MEHDKPKQKANSVIGEFWLHNEEKSNPLPKIHPEFAKRRDWFLGCMARYRMEETSCEKIEWELDKAKNYARITSCDKHTKVGAMIIHTDGSTTFGANGLTPKTFANYNEKYDAHMIKRPDKYEFLEHAERYAIFNAFDEGRKVKGTTMIAPWFSCPDCARAIVLSGITHVVGCYSTIMNTPEPWHDRIERGWEILRNEGVRMSANRIVRIEDSNLD